MCGNKIGKSNIYTYILYIVYSICIIYINIIIPRKIKYLGVNLTSMHSDLYAANYKMLRKEVKGTLK